MGVPKEILAVPRPTNTVVQDLGGGGLRRFAVLERKGIVKKGDKRYPCNGRVVGHIIDGKFVAKEPKANPCAESMLSYGVSALVKQIMDDVQSELLSVYDAGDVYSLMALVAIRVKRPGIALSTVDTVFRSSYASLYWKDAAVSKNSLSSLLERIGEDVSKRRQFFRKHVGSIANGNGLILINGTVKQNTTTVDELSGYSYKTRIKDTQDIPLLYAFSTEKNEPLCAEVYSGNCSDVSVVCNFVEHNGIKIGIIIADKGLPLARPKDIKRDYPNLYYLMSLKRNSDYIKEYCLLDFNEGDAKLGKSGVLYKTAKTADGLFLYSFLDIDRAAFEQRDWQQCKLSEGNYDLEEFRNKRDSFGTIAFVSDIELNPETVYSNYMDRWVAGLAFDRYKNDLELDGTRESDKFSMEGNEFVNFLCTLATFRILNRMADIKLLETTTYAQLIDELDLAQRSSEAPLDIKPKRGDGYWANNDFEFYGVLESLGLCEPEHMDKREGEDETNLKDKKLKRPVGRPRTKKQSTAEKRPRGRPRKEKPEFVQPTRPVGRPRIHPLELDKPKRPRGRPRKNSLPAFEIQ